MLDKFGKYTPEEALSEANLIKKELRDKYTVQQDSYLADEYSDAEKAIELQNDLTEDQLEKLREIKAKLRFDWQTIDSEELKNIDLPEELIGLSIANNIAEYIRHSGQIPSKKIEEFLTQGIIGEDQARHAIVGGSVLSVKERPFSQTYSCLVEDATPWVDLMSIPEYRARAEDVIIYEILPREMKIASGGVYNIKKYLLPLGIIPEIIVLPSVQEAAIKGYSKALDNSVSHSSTPTYALSRQSNQTSEDSIKEFFCLSDEQLYDVQIDEVAKWLRLGNDIYAFDCIERTKLSDETLLVSVEFLEASRSFLIEMCRRDLDKSDHDSSIYDAIEYIDRFKFNAELLSSSEVQEAAKPVFLHYIEHGGDEIGTADHIANAFQLPQDFLTSPEAKHAATEGAIKTIKSGSLDTVEYYQRAIELTQLSPETLATNAEDALFAMFGRSGAQKTRKFALGLGMSEDQFTETAKSCLIKALDKGPITIAMEIYTGMKFSEEFYSRTEIQDKIMENFYKKAANGDVFDMRQIYERFNLQEDLDHYNKDILFNIRQKLDFQTMPELLNFAKNYNGYCRFLAKTKKDWLLGLDELNQTEKIELEPEEAHLLVENEFDLFSEWEESSDTGGNGWKQAYEILIEHRDDLDFEFMGNVLMNLGVAGRVFGYKKMFNYMLNNNVGRREALDDFGDILTNLYEASGLDSDQFYTQILQQVLDDSSDKYPGRSAIRWLNEIAKKINPEQMSIKDAPGLADISFLQELFRQIDSKSSMDIFGSWDNLKRFYDIQRLAKNISSRNYTFNEILELYKLHDIKPPADLALAHQLFGNFLNEEIYRDFRLLSQGVLSDLFRNLGVRHTGEAGMSEVRERLSGVRRSFKQPDFHGEGLDNPTIAAMFKQFVSYETSSWGNHDDEEFEEVVDYHRALVEKGRWTDVPPDYKPSEVLMVDKIDRVQQLTFDYSEQFVSRFNTLKDSIISAISLVEESHPLETLATNGEQIRIKLVAEWSSKLQEMEDAGQNPKAISNLKRNIDSLQAVDFRSVKDFEHNFQLLGNFREFHELLRQFIFLLAFRNNRQSIEEAKRNLENEMPSIDNISWALDFIDHITNQETRDRYFEDEKAKRSFLQITNPRALSEELSKAQNQEVIGKMPIQFIPTRGLTLEFSGHIANACWASQLTSIAEKYPNFVSVNIVKNPESANESLAGACLLIRTKSDKGEPLLIIRGLNPNENTINQLSVADFFDKFVAFVRPIAEAEGRKLAIVCDHCGGASTNRPVLFDYINSINLNKKVRPASDQDTTFNDYELNGITFLLEN